MADDATNQESTAPEPSPEQAAASPDGAPGAAATPPDEQAEAARAAKEAVAAAKGAAGAPDEPSPLELPVFEEAEDAVTPANIDLLGDVNLNVTIELGRTRMLVEDVLRLAEGAVVELDKLAGDPVDVYVNGRHIARGEVLVLNDNFCVRINEIIEDEVEEAPSARSAA